MWGSTYFGDPYFGDAYFGSTGGGVGTLDPANATLDYTAPRMRAGYVAPRMRMHYTWSTTVTGPLITETRTKHPDDVVDLAVDFTPRLGKGVSLTGTPTAEVLSGSGLTVGTVAVNTAAVEINGRNVPAGGAVLVRVSAGTDGITYRIQVEAETDASSAETLNVVLDLEVSNT